MFIEKIEWPIKLFSVSLSITNYRTSDRMNVRGLYNMCVAEILQARERFEDYQSLQRSVSGAKSPTAFDEFDMEQRHRRARKCPERDVPIT